MKRAHEKLEARKLAMKLVTDLYRATSSFPKEELYGLTSQIRRAAVSIPARILRRERRAAEPKSSSNSFTLPVVP